MLLLSDSTTFALHPLTSFINKAFSTTGNMQIPFFFQATHSISEGQILTYRLSIQHIFSSVTGSRRFCCPLNDETFCWWSATTSLGKGFLYIRGLGRGVCIKQPRSFKFQAFMSKQNFLVVSHEESQSDNYVLLCLKCESDLNVQLIISFLSF